MSNSTLAKQSVSRSISRWHSESKYFRMKSKFVTTTRKSRIGLQQQQRVGEKENNQFNKQPISIGDLALFTTFPWRKKVKKQKEKESKDILQRWLVEDILCKKQKERERDSSNKKRTHIKYNAESCQSIGWKETKMDAQRWKEGKTVTKCQSGA